VALEQAVAAPLCTRHLADLGADVVKIERPDGGDFARQYDSVVGGQSAYFVWLNRGKRSAALDLKCAADRTTLDGLLARADVFVHNLGPGAVERLGLGWQAVHERWPGLIVCAISGYGADGPYRGRKAFDLLLQGEGAIMDVTGTPDEPVKVGISIADLCAGVYAFSGILAALHQRRQTEAGTFLDISMLDCLAEWMMVPAYHQLYAGAAPPRTGSRHNMIVPYGPYRVGDGSLVNLAVQNESQWKRLCERVLGMPQLAQEPRFGTNELRVQNRVELEKVIEAALANDTRTTAEERLRTADIPFGALNRVSDLVAHPQLAARGRWFEVDTSAGPVIALAHPFNISGLPQRRGPVPALGADTDAVRREALLPLTDGHTLRADD
jgi:crotonobetainyl-CoA:carnitine CoA-transferase CaiB-like acyl-CoA transferase